MAFDFNEARLIVEAAKKRGIIQAPGEPEVPVDPNWKAKEGTTVLPEWLQDDGYRERPRR